MAKPPGDNYSENEAKARFEAALKGAMNTPHKPLKGIIANIRTLSMELTDLLKLPTYEETPDEQPPEE